MTPILSANLSSKLNTNFQGSERGIDIDNVTLHKAATEFEAAFIAQMLTFSGLGDALTVGGGEDASAFASFYIESYADKISGRGGFGLAEHFYKNLLSQNEKTSEDAHVNTRKM